MVDHDILSATFWPRHFVHNILSTTFCPRHCIHDILTTTFWPHILSTAFCPRHFVQWHWGNPHNILSAKLSVTFCQWHFVLEPRKCDAFSSSAILLLKGGASLRPDSLKQRVAYRAPGFERPCAQNARKTHWGTSACALASLRQECTSAGQEFIENHDLLEFNFHSLDDQIDSNPRRHQSQP